MSAILIENFNIKISLFLLFHANAKDRKKFIFKDIDYFFKKFNSKEPSFSFLEKLTMRKKINFCELAVLFYTCFCLDLKKKLKK